jgi:multidrug efflux system membrane fusion protein
MMSSNTSYSNDSQRGGKPHSKQRWALRATAAAGLIAIVAIGATVFHAEPSHADNPPANARPPATPVSVATVASSEVSVWSEFSGRLEAVDHVDVRSRVAGAVAGVHFREGELVKKGDLLLTIDPAPYAAEVDRAQAQVVAAQARALYLKSELERAQRLWDDKAIAQRELDERVNAQREADANLRAAQASLQSARLSLDYTQVRAPVSGRVGKLQITVGNLVAAGPGAPVLTTLVSVDPIYASFDADEHVVTKALRDLPAGRYTNQLDSIPVQMSTEAFASNEAPLQGKLQLIDNQVDPRSGTVRVRAVFDNPGGRLMPGQFARLRMGQAKAGTALLINERAVGTDQDKQFVLVVGEGNKAVYREVVLGSSVNGLRIVNHGLKEGERIVVSGLQRVRPGALLNPQPVAMDAKPEAQAQQDKKAAPQS